MSNVECEANENVLLSSNQFAADEQLSQVIKSSNVPNTNDDKQIDQSSSSATTNRATGQTLIGAKIVEKLEKLAADSKEDKNPNNKVSSVTNKNDNVPLNKTNGSNSNQSVNEVAQSLLALLNNTDPQKNILSLATKLADLQEQNRLTQAKINESDKRLTGIIRERDQILIENSRALAAKTKLEGLCRELHQHNQQIRDESTRKQQDEEVKRQELAKKFQTTIDEISSQLSNYSVQSTSLHERNVQLSEQLQSVVKDYELREKEYDAAFKTKKAELRLAEASLEKSHALLNERTELIKQERQASEAERLVIYKKCEDLVRSELTLRSQLKLYTERHQEFENAIQQSGQMVTSCNTEIERMGTRVKSLEEEKVEFRQRWETAKQSQQKLHEDMKVLEKEKRQLDIRIDKLDRLCRTLQEQRSDLKEKIKDLTKSSTNISLATTMDHGLSGLAKETKIDEKVKHVTSDVPTTSKIPVNANDSLNHDALSVPNTTETNQ